MFNPNHYKPPLIGNKSIHLDFGCGSVPRNPFRCDQLVTLDIFPYSKLIPKILIKPGQSIPLEDNSVSSVSAYDVIEHLSRDSSGENLFIFYMNELYRVLAPGGYALLIFPGYPGKDAFSDPTHVNYITDSTINYFIDNAYPPYYAGIKTNFEKILNQKLRLWKQWVTNSNEELMNDRLSIRRKLSLAKRSLIRATFPQHRIWLLRKI